jgi:hypothetical protein
MKYMQPTQPLPIDQQNQPVQKSANNALMILGAAALVLVSGGIGYAMGVQQPKDVGVPPIESLPPEEGIACTMDAKICPDGSGVGRSGPNCEFAPCPGEATESSDAGKPTGELVTYAKDGFSFQYPQSWKFGENGTEVCLASNQVYVDFYCNEKTGLKLPSTGFKTTQVGLAEGLDTTGMSEKEALKLEHGRSVFPLIEEKYVTINGQPAYRAIRQIKEGDSMYDQPYQGVTRTDIEFTYLKNNQLYRLWFELDDNNPEKMISLFDQVAQSVTIK